MWTSTDPQEQDWNVYGYCGGNPINFIDPNGEIWGWIIGAAVGATIGGIYGYNNDRANWGWYALGGAIAGGIAGGAIEEALGAGSWTGGSGYTGSQATASAPAAATPPPATPGPWVGVADNQDLITRYLTWNQEWNAYYAANIVSNPGLEMFYNQLTGVFSALNQVGQLVINTTGYAGNGPVGIGAGLNNQDLQNMRNVGPIPQGDWNVSGIATNGTHMGRNAIEITPRAGTNTYGRAGFYIHGNNAFNNFSASQGCIILNSPARQTILNAGGGLLHVF